MKTRKFMVAALAALTMLGYTGCKDDDSNEREATLTVGQTIVEFDAEGGDVQVSVNSSEVWTAQTSTDWCTAEKTSATALTIVAAANENTEARQAIVTITGGNRTATVTVSQEAEQITILGEWYTESVEPNMIVRTTSEYKADGTSAHWMGASIVGLSVFGSYEGTYTYNGAKKTLKYVNIITGGNTTEESEVRLLDKYTLEEYFTESTSLQQSYRIVDNYNMTVGQSRKMDIGDRKFQATGYVSTDAAVASVDGEGNIVANKRGMAFVKATSAIGTAYVRVKVEDPDNVVDDFMSFMGEDMDDVTAIYGNIFYDIPNPPATVRYFYPIDEMVEQVAFTYSSNRVIRIEATVRDGADLNAITASFQRKNTQGQTSDQYEVERDGQTYILMWHPTERTIYCMPKIEIPAPEYTDADFETFAGLMPLNAGEAAQKLNYTLTEEDWENGFFYMDIKDNEVFRRINVIFDEEEEPHEVRTVILTPKTNISRDMIEPWYQAHYTATDDALNPYVSDTDPVYYVQFRETASGAYTVYYSKSKRRK